MKNIQLVRKKACGSDVTKRAILWRVRVKNRLSPDLIENCENLVHTYCKILDRRAVYS